MSDYVFLAEALIFAGAALAWGVWELWSLRRERARDAAASIERTRHPDG